MKEGFCKERVFPPDRYGCFHPHQCKNKVWLEYPEDGFCKAHHPLAVEARHKAASERYKQEWDNSPIARLMAVTKQRDAAVNVINDWILVMEAHTEASHFLDGFHRIPNEWDYKLVKARAIIKEIEGEK